MSNKSIELQNMDSSIDVPTKHKAGVAKPKALYAALGVMTTATIGLSVALGVVMSGDATNLLSPSDMAAAAPVSVLADTRNAFSAGESTLFGGDSSTYTPETARSSNRIGRYAIPATDKTPHKSATGSKVFDANGVQTHEHIASVLKQGVSTLGEFADKYGQVGPRTIRLNVKDYKTGDHFTLVPIGLSMVGNNADHNVTMTPDLFYFSHQKAGTKPEDRVVSFCSTAHKDRKGRCFLGKGQDEWDAAVQPWANSYLAALKAEQAAAKTPAGRRLLNLGGDIGGYVGEKAGDWAGGKIGEEVGTDVGAAVGSLAGPVGTAVGAAVGGWAGEKIGSHYGGEIGEAAGSWAGSSIENDFGR